MAQMTFRMADDVEEALAELAADGRDRSEVLRELILRAHREQHRARLRADAERLSKDPAYLAEVAAVRAELDEISAW
ncbi:MAG: hypothetical protein M3548_10950 [Actinomycetota bacterium]|nr:hypothetical protein [Actinomycetota bacterium]